MKKVSVIKTAMMYAGAMYEGALKSGDLDTLYDDAKHLKDVVDNADSGIQLLNNPLWKFKQKAEIIDLIVQKCNFGSSMGNTLKLLAENNDFGALAQTLDQFILLYQQKHNIAEIEVTTVIPLSAKQESLLKAKLANIFEREIVLRYVINPQIIGGLVIKYGTNFIDNSVKHKLDALEQLMKGAK